MRVGETVKTGFKSTGPRNAAHSGALNGPGAPFPASAGLVMVPRNGIVAVSRTVHRARPVACSGTEDSRLVLAVSVKVLRSGSNL